MGDSTWFFRLESKKMPADPCNIPYPRISNRKQVVEGRFGMFQGYDQEISWRKNPVSLECSNKKAVRPLVFTNITMDTIHDVHSIYREKCWFAMSILVYCSLYLAWIRVTHFHRSNYTKLQPPHALYHTVPHVTWWFTANMCTTFGGSRLWKISRFYCHSKSFCAMHPSFFQMSPHLVAVASLALLQDRPGKRFVQLLRFSGDLESKCQTNIGSKAPIRLLNPKRKV